MAEWHWIVQRLKIERKEAVYGNLLVLIRGGRKSSKNIFPWFVVFFKIFSLSTTQWKEIIFYWVVIFIRNTTTNNRHTMVVIKIKFVFNLMFKLMVIQSLCLLCFFLLEKQELSTSTTVDKWLVDEKNRGKKKENSQNSSCSLCCVTE